jgi:membrane protein
MSKPAESITAVVVGSTLLLIGATSVFAELQDALDRIWRAPKTAQGWHLAACCGLACCPSA